MRVALIARSTLYTVPDGDTTQVTETCRFLNKLGMIAEVRLSSGQINYELYDLLHFFNLIRPADIFYQSRKANKPYVISTILVDYNEYDKHHRGGLASIFNYLSADGIEYMKTMAQCTLGCDCLASRNYIWKGQKRGIMEILRKAAMIPPNSESEYRRVEQYYPTKVKYKIIPNRIGPGKFAPQHAKKRDDTMLCVASVEDIKNQANLIEGLNNSKFNVTLVGSGSPGQSDYYKYCTGIAAGSIQFIDYLPQHELVKYYRQAKGHILPSWFEATGLVSLEAAVIGCNIVISNRSDAREYFGNHAFYYDPADPESLLQALQQASETPCDKELRNLILEKYTWQQAALQTLKHINQYYETAHSHIRNTGNTQQLRRF